MLLVPLVIFCVFILLVSERDLLKLNCTVDFHFSVFHWQCFLWVATLFLMTSALLRYLITFVCGWVWACMCLCGRACVFIIPHLVCMWLVCVYLCVSVYAGQRLISGLFSQLLSILFNFCPLSVLHVRSWTHTRGGWRITWWTCLFPTFMWVLGLECQVARRVGLTALPAKPSLQPHLVLVFLGIWKSLTVVLC